MATIAFPSITPEIQEFGIVYNTQVSSSPISGITQTVELPGARWRGSVSFRDMTSSESAALKSFLLRLRGSAGRFYYGDQSHTDPFNAVTGSPTIDGANSTNRIIRVTLGTSSPTFSEGDYIQIGTDEQRELKMVLVSALVSGDTYDLTIEPAIRRTDYDTLQVVYSDPVGTFMLTSSDQAKWAIRSKANLSDISLDFVEVFS